MTLLTGLGSAGIGLVWGWMLGWLGPASRGWSWLAAGAATLAAAAATWSYAGWGGAVVFAAASGLAVLLHFGLLEGRA